MRFKIACFLFVGLLFTINTFAQVEKPEEKAKMQKDEMKPKDEFTSKGGLTYVMVGESEMYPSKDIITNASMSKDHTTLVAAVKAAGLLETLQGEGPFTVFAPTNDAFENLPAGMADKLLKPENKEKLSGILAYHVVPGKYGHEELSKLIKQSGDGKAELKTVAGGLLTAKMNGPHNIVVVDENGNSANIITYDVWQSNGITHVVDAVAMPK